MHSQSLLRLISSILLLISLTVYYQVVNCDHATQFVLESADPTPAPQSSHIQQKSNSQASVIKHSELTSKPSISSQDIDNTRIITDDVAPLESNKQETPKQNQNEQISSIRNSVPKTDGPEARRLKDSINKKLQQVGLRTSSTTSTVAPKIEDRLLISISSAHEDDEVDSSNGQTSAIVGGSSIGNQNNKNNGGGSSGSYSNDSPYSNKQESKPRPKPAILISIDNKQSGSGPMPAVVLRPTENGQGIVLSVADSNGQQSKPIVVQDLSSNNNNNYNNNNNNHNNNNNDEQSSILSNSNSNQNSGYQPYSYSTSTTYRPSLNNNANSNYQDQNQNNQNRPNSNNRPITSTLIDSPNYDRPISRPVNPPNEPISSSSGSSYDENSYNQNSRPSSTSSYNNEKQPQSLYPLNERNCGQLQETRIVGGEEVDKNGYQWMVAIIKSKPKDGEPRPFCGGSLITRRHVLTAAHCLENMSPRDILVRIGSYVFDDSASASSVDHAVDQFRVPAEYSKKTHAADIAIMRLKNPLQTTDIYRTVCMPQKRRSYTSNLATVIGYGSQSQSFRKQSTKLRQVSVPIIENETCSRIYKKPMNDSFLCAGFEEGGRDACQGDSGGPLMVEGPTADGRLAIAGVVSHGIGCGGSYPGVYTRVSTYLDWIEKNTQLVY